MEQYLKSLNEVIVNGVEQLDRTNIGTLNLFGTRNQYSLRDNFPIITTKKMSFNSIKSELLWFLSGSTDERRLAEILYQKPREELTTKNTIWTPNAQSEYWKPKAKFDGDLGKIYGYEWRSWQTADGRFIDQIQNLIDGIKHDPNSRRHIVITYNPGELENMALPPCHALFQMFVSNGTLSCQMYQRSVDKFLGECYNISSYALLTCMIAHVCDLKPNKFIHVKGVDHIYLNHIEQVKEQLTRTPLPLPTLWLNPKVKNIFDFTMDDIKLINYTSLPAIKADMAV